MYSRKHRYLLALLWNQFNYILWFKILKTNFVCLSKMSFLFLVWVEFCESNCYEILQDTFLEKVHLL